MPTQQRIGIVGFRGYSGAELVRILQHHPRVDTVLLEHRADAPDRPQPLHQNQPARLPCSADSVRSEKLDLVFLATPAESRKAWTLNVGFSLDFILLELAIAFITSPPDT